MYQLKKLLFIVLLISLIGGMVYAENYRLTEEGVQRLSDTAFIPATMKNADWRDYQDWLEEGNAPEAKLPPPVLVVDEKEEKVKARMRKKAIQELISESELPADYK